MKFLIGAALGSIGLYLLMAAHLHRARIRSARVQAVQLGVPAEKPVGANSVAALGEMVAPIVLVALGWFTIKICFAYYVLQPSEYVSLFDLAGTLALVGGYASWLLAKTHYRMPDLGRWKPAAHDAPPVAVREPIAAEFDFDPAFHAPRTTAQSSAALVPGE